MMSGCSSKSKIIVTVRRWRSEDRSSAAWELFLDSVEEPGRLDWREEMSGYNPLRLRGRLLALRFFHRQLFTIAPILERTIVEMGFVAEVTGDEI